MVFCYLLLVNISISEFHHSAPNVLSKSVMFLVGINLRRMNPLTMQQDIAVMTPTTMNCWEG